MSPKMPRALWTQLKDRAGSPIPFWKGSHVQTWDSSVPVFCWKKGKFLQFGNKRWVIPCPEKNRGLHLGDWHKPCLAHGLCRSPRSQGMLGEKGSVPVPFALWFAKAVLGRSPLGLALAAELGRVWEPGLCFRLH